MATDSTQVQFGETSVETESDMAMGGQDLGSVQLAAATDAPVQVDIPQGQNVVRIPVQPGQAIELPTASADGLLAKFGAEGNLAIVVDGRTIILQGYAAANDEAPVKIVTNDGDTVDVAELIAATDPGLDIQTAAGPAAGAQGNTTPGGGIYNPFGPGAGLGGLDAVGVLDPTALRYRLIDNKTRLFDREEDDEPALVPPNGFPSALGNEVAQLDDDDVAGAGGIAGGVGDDAAPLNISGVLGHDYGSDGAGSLLLLSSGALPAGFTAVLSGGGTVLTISQDGTPVLKITLSDTVSGEYHVEQLAPIAHPAGGDENNLVFTVAYQVTDGNGDTATGSLKINVDDDTPTLTLDPVIDRQQLFSLSTEVDETEGPDRESPIETADGNNDGDNPGLGRSTTNVAGGLTALFTIGGGYGADGAGSTNGALSFVGIPPAGLATTLEATDGGAITLFLNGSTEIQGKDTNGDVVFTIAIVDVGGGVFQLQTTLYEALVHPDHERFDETVTLTLEQGLVQLQYQVTRIDSDGDPVTKSATIDLISEETSYFRFDDDGPSIAPSDTSVPTLVVDETDLGTNDSESFAGLFTASFGADGAGSVGGYALGISAPGAASGLVDTASGNPVFLFLEGGVVVGREGTSALDAAGGDVVFTISVSPAGVVTLDQQRAVVHGDPLDPDEADTPATLSQQRAVVHGDPLDPDEADTPATLSAANLVTLSATVTDKDGDSASTSVNIGSSFKFEDDGPSVSSNLKVQLDDDALTGGNDGGTGDDANSANTPGTLAHSYGADGAGTTLLLETGEPDGFTYTLSLDGKTLTISQDSTGLDVLKVELSDTTSGGYTVTQLNPISHPTGDAENNVEFTINYQVTDKDGDTASGSLLVNVDDDTPIAIDDAKSAGVAATINGNVLTDGTDDSFGADGKGTPAITQVVFKGVTYTDISDGNPDGKIHVTGDFGNLELDTATGAYSYTRTSDITAVGQDVFTYTIKDGDGDTDSATLTISSDAANILNGNFVTNTNSGKQVALVTFVDAQDPLRAFAQLIVRDSQGQQGAILTDAGFMIDSTHEHLVSMEATAGTKVIVTDFSLEGVNIVDPGNAQLEVNDDKTSANEATGIVQLITPATEGGTLQEFEYSLDDPNSGAHTLNDPNAAGSGADYVFGGSGGDTINGSTGPNVLNGGDVLNASNNGGDTINGGSGTDVLVFDKADTLDGNGGFDIVRVDQGAIYNTMIAQGLVPPATLTNATVDMRNASISDVESILITEEAAADPTKGTKLQIEANDVLDFTDANNKLYIIGSKGDSVEVDLNGETLGAPTVINDDVRGMVFHEYHLSNGGTLLVDADVTVTTIP